MFAAKVVSTFAVDVHHIVDLMHNIIAAVVVGNTSIG